MHWCWILNATVDPDPELQRFIRLGVRGYDSRKNHCTSTANIDLEKNTGAGMVCVRRSSWVSVFLKTGFYKLFCFCVITDLDPETHGF
jgi:hypothetical protein